jgi:manganese/zinc/iron transport system permease protein
VLLIGALIAGLIGAFCIQAITRYSRVKEDAALGLVLSVFFGVGIVLLTFIQQSGRASQAGLDKFLFGQAASLIGTDVQVMAVCAALVCALSVAFFKEFKLLCFDQGFARGLGYSTGLVDGLLMLLIVLAVVVGLQAVGVVLMAALLITPAAAARFWTDRLNTMVWLAGVFGALSGAVGTLMSGALEGMPTGPVIVLAATLVFLVSLVFAPRRGLLAKAVRLLVLRARVGREHALRAFYELAERAGSWELKAGPAEPRRRGPLPAHRNRPGGGVRGGA